jgi:hypothetical protein
MTTKKLEELTKLSDEFDALNKKEQKVRRKQQARSWEVLQAETRVEKILLNTASFMQILAKQGIRYFEVMTFASYSLTCGWNRNLFGDEVTLDFVKDPVVRKVFRRLLKMGYRPKIIYDPLPRASHEIADYFKIIITW